MLESFIKFMPNRKKCKRFIFPPFDAKISEKEPVRFIKILEIVWQENEYVDFIFLLHNINIYLRNM